MEFFEKGQLKTPPTAAGSNIQGENMHLAKNLSIVNPGKGRATFVPSVLQCFSRK